MKVNLGRHLDEISVKLEEHIDSILRWEICKPDATSSVIQQLLELKIELKNLEAEGNRVIFAIFLRPQLFCTCDTIVYY